MPIKQVFSPTHRIDVFKDGNKDIIFVIDVSGSMSGEKIRQAKRGLNFFLEHLNPEDRFNIIAFSSDLNLFKKTLVDATEENIQKVLLTSSFSQMASLLWVSPHLMR